MQKLLEIHDLVVAFDTESGELIAVDGVSIELAKGQTLALVGESGCGKTVLCKSMLHILCEKGRVKKGEILFEGKNLAIVSEKEIQGIRGKDIAMVFQDPNTSLNPTVSVGKQITEVICLHQHKGKAESKQKAAELLQMVGIEDAEKRFHQKPHQFSGGMRQRVAIAIALAGNPKLLLADEPTTALDVKTQEQILTLIKNLQKQLQISMIFITHDLSLVERVADQAAIMQQGKIVEIGNVSSIFSNPQHEYTKRLIHYLNYGRGTTHSHGKQVERAEILAEALHVKKSFRLDKNSTVKALDGVSLKIYRGEIAGLVGPSGCGKTTLARCLMGIDTPDSGTIKFYGKPTNRYTFRQMIFQDSTSAFNQRMTIGQIIGEPLRIQNKRQPDKSIITKLMEQVELEAALFDRYPYEVSGGQRQRAAIARALSVDPDFIVADEPLSSLDVTIQAQIAHLFKKLQEERNLTILLISHDLPMAQHISDRIIDLNDN